jgi:branched-chain amino acid aminotransferase
MDADAKVWIDGEIVGIDEARVPVLDHGLLYGDGIFEGLRVYGGRVFRLPDHLRRISTGARALGLELPGGVSALEKIVLDTARAYARPEAYVRLIVTRGEGELGVDPASCERPRVICIVAGISLFSEEKMRRGLDLVTVSLRRPPADALDPAVKSLNYLNSVLAKREARMRGADEALILNQQGMVAEAAVANVFMVRDGALRTPPVCDGALPGITRASVIELAEAAGLPVAESTLGRVDLFGADEVFLTGSGARIVPVATLDGQPIGEPGSFPIMRQLSDAFAEFVLERGTAF